MKNKVLIITASVMLCCGCFVSHHYYQQRCDEFSTVMLENVEALANEEELPPKPVPKCSQGCEGVCFKRGEALKMCGERMFYECTYTGYLDDYCTNPC